MNITIYSRRSIEKLARSGYATNAAIISFSEPPREGEEPKKPINFSGKAERVFRATLENLTYAELTARGMGIGSYFPEAEALAEFIVQAAKDGLDFICQCEDGRTLSAGCAAALHEYFNSDGVFIFADYHYAPSQMVFHKIYNALWFLKNPAGESPEKTQ